MVLTFDTETTTFEKGNPFSIRNDLCYIGYKVDNSDVTILKDRGYWYRLQEFLNKKPLLVGFNIKRDLHWLQRVGLKFDGCKVWDCQLAFFMETGQRHPYPSMDDVSKVYGLPVKPNVVKDEYWDKGIDTPDIPYPIMEEYLTHDVNTTYEIFKIQKQKFETKLKDLFPLFHLCCEDLLVLQEMEANGMRYHVQASLEQAETIKKEIEEIDRKLNSEYPLIPLDFNKRRHVSAFLYGGPVAWRSRVLNGVFKTGDRKGQPKYKWVDHEETLPRKVIPKKGSELDDERYFSTDEKTIRTLNPTKEVKKSIELLQKRAELVTLVSRYLEGLPKLIEEKDWPAGWVFGNLNQCVAATGRLSSNEPNLQNVAESVKRMFISRYSSDVSESRC